MPILSWFLSFFLEKHGSAILFFFPMGSDFFSEKAESALGVRENAGRQKRGKKSHDKAAQNVGGEMKIEIKTRKGGQQGEHQRRRSGLFVLPEEREGARKGDGGMSGGKGGVAGKGQSDDKVPQFVGAGPRDDRFEKQVCEKRGKKQGDGHGKAVPAGRPEEKKDQGQKNPEPASVRKEGNDLQKTIEKGAAKVGGDPVVDGEIDLIEKRQGNILLSCCLILNNPFFLSGWYAYLFSVFLVRVIHLAKRASPDGQRDKKCFARKQVRAASPKRRFWYTAFFLSAPAIPFSSKKFSNLPLGQADAVEICADRSASGGNMCEQKRKRRKYVRTEAHAAEKMHGRRAFCRRQDAGVRAEAGISSPG